MKIALLIIDVQQAFVGHQQNTPFMKTRWHILTLLHRCFDNSSIPSM